VCEPCVSHLTSPAVESQLKGGGGDGLRCCQALGKILRPFVPKNLAALGKMSALGNFSMFFGIRNTISV
jgi:hypothetical protein